MVYEEQEQIGNIDLVKQLNGAVVYRLIDQQGPISRIQIADISRLAPASVTKITRQLLERKLIKEVEQQASTGGRRAISIISETDRFHTLAVRLGRKDATINLFDLAANSLARARYLMPNGSQQELENALIQAISIFIQEQQHIIQELIAISVVLPGLVEAEQGIIKYMPHVAVNHWHLADTLSQHFQLKSFVGHDIRSLALAEHYFGATRDCQDSLLVRLHRGTGAGIIVNGKLFLSSKGNAGEIGHTQVDPLGEHCHCGNFGCLETITSNTAIEKRVQSLLQQGHPSTLLSQKNCTINAITHAANQGDQLAVQIIEHVGHSLGKMLAISVNLFNPQKIVIAGEITVAQQILLPAIQHCINTQALKSFRTELPIVVSELDHHSAIAAFALVKRAMLDGSLLQQLL